MLKNKTIFILSNTKYDAVFESTSYTVAKHLAKENAVYYIEYPATIKDYFKQKNSQEYKKKKPYYSRTSDGIISTEFKNLKILIIPFLLSINFLPEGMIYRLLLKFNEKKIVKRINDCIKKFDLKDIVYINSFNIYYPNISKFIPSTLNVYHCVDPLIVGFDLKHGVISEKIILNLSDLVICTSKQLYREKKLLHPHTYFIPNAADISHSAKVNHAETQTLSLLNHINHPIIGYFGNIERRMDYPLLTKVFELNQDKNFVFVGPYDVQLVPQDWFQKKNVHFTNSVPYELMPSALKSFDVAIIPFKKDEVSNTIFPLKLFEYLGSGKPVVATNFNPDLVEFTNSTINYCNNEIEFTEELNNCLNNDNKEKRERRLEVANANTWDIRMREFSELLSKHL